jgi:hypothetical protein
MSQTEWGVNDAQNFSYDFSSGVGYVTKKGLSATAQGLAQGTYPASAILGGGIQLQAEGIDADTKIQVICLDSTGAQIPGTSLDSSFIQSSPSVVAAKYMFAAPLAAGALFSWKINSGSLAGVSQYTRCVATVVV